MTFTEEQSQVVQGSVRDLAVSSARLCLFGSRVHAEAVGDGVDLPIPLPYPVEAPAGPAVWTFGRRMTRQPVASYTEPTEPSPAPFMPFSRPGSLWKTTHERSKRVLTPLALPLALGSQ